MPSPIYINSDTNLISKWDYELNPDVDPSRITVGNSSYFWWKCEKGHSYPSTPQSQRHGSGCTVCSGKYVLKNVNDLETVRPDLACQWDYSKNGDLSPRQFTKGSSQKVWWKCALGHSWKATISSRGKNGCPKCNDFGTSFPEQSVYFYVKQVYGDAINRFKGEPWELDVYMPSSKIAVEYDGRMFHKGEKQVIRDNKKDAWCREQGIKLIRIREKGLDRTESAICIFRECDKDISLEKSINALMDYLDCEIDINIDKDRVDILNLYTRFIKAHSLEKEFPEIAKEWNYEKNGSLTPSMVAKGTHQKVWWICKNGHEYESSPAKRCITGRGCSYCAHQKVEKGKTDFASQHPELLNEWDYEKNEVSPEEVFSNSHKKVYWKCKSGHESYPASLANKCKGRGCPMCDGKIRERDKNSFGVLHPELLEQIHPIQDRPFDPYEFGPSSEREVHWICEKGHDWYARIKKRSLGQGCPYCSNNKVWTGFNDLEYLYPDVAKEWHPTKNGDLLPSKVLSKKNSKAWWLCSKCGESYEAFIANRTSKGTSHRNCKNKMIKDT